MKSNLAKKSSALLALIFAFAMAHAQEQRMKIKYGDVKAEDFKPEVYSVDSSAAGIYLFDGGNSEFKSNNKGGFQVRFTRHARIRLLKKQCFEDLAKVELEVKETSDYKQELIRFDATVYNIDGNTVTATKMDNNMLIMEKSVKTRTGDIKTYKATFPNVKEGSIVEYKYIIDYPGIFTLKSWQFQSKYPRLWSEYETTVPEFYRYIVLKNGYLPYTYAKSTETTESYYISDNATAFQSNAVSISANAINSVWAIKDVPPIKPSSFVTTLENYRSKIDFQLSAIAYPNEPVRPIMNDWIKEASDLMKDDDFGMQLTNGNGWMSDVLKPIMASAKSDKEKAEGIYNYIKNNFSETDDEALYLSQTLKKTFDEKKGNVADINLLLTAMLIKAGLNARPIILSKRDNGFAYDLYPIMEQYDYVISTVSIDNKDYKLDATDASLGFGILGEDCYNKSARVIDELPRLVPMSADSLKEDKLTFVFIENGDKKMEGSYTSQYGNMESWELRNQIKSESQQDFFTKIKKSFSYDMNMLNTNIDSLKNYDDPVKVHFDFDFTNDDDIVYFNPLMNEQQHLNPFTSETRFYPVEMPYCSNENYILNMDVPTGYKVDDLPKSARVTLNDSDGIFEYLIAVTDDKIQLRCHTKINKANFDPDDYQTLRDFFAYVVKKESEQIVFKKVK